MKRIVSGLVPLALASLLLLSSPVWSQVLKTKDLTFQRGEMTITLTHTKCSNPTVRMIMMTYMGIDPTSPYQFYDGSVTVNKVKSPLCYAVNPADVNQLFMVDAEGNSGPLLLVEPKKTPGV